MDSTSRPSVQTVESLGDITYETKPNASNLVAGVILSVLFVAGGVTVSSRMIQRLIAAGGHRPLSPADWIGAVMIACFGFSLVVVGIYLFVWMNSLFRFRLYICHSGFYITRGRNASVFAWNEIVEVHEHSIREKLPLFKGIARLMLPTMTSRFYTVVRCDGKKFDFNDNVIPRTSILAGPLSSAAQSHEFVWKTSEDSPR